jgi:hypothetical protein
VITERNQEDSSKMTLYVLCRNSEAHTVLKRTNLWIQEWYHAEIKFNGGQIIQAKL